MVLEVADHTVPSVRQVSCCALAPSPQEEQEVPDLVDGSWEHCLLDHVRPYLRPTRMSNGSVDRSMIPLATKIVVDRDLIAVGNVGKVDEMDLVIGGP
jgi:hypothetical protein